MVRRATDPSLIFSGLQAQMEAKLRGPQGTNDVDELDWLRHSDESKRQLLLL